MERHTLDGTGRERWLSWRQREKASTNLLDEVRTKGHTIVGQHQQSIKKKIKNNERNYSIKRSLWPLPHWEEWSDEANRDSWPRGPGHTLSIGQTSEPTRYYCKEINVYVRRRLIRHKGMETLVMNFALFVHIFILLSV